MHMAAIAAGCMRVFLLVALWVLVGLSGCAESGADAPAEDAADEPPEAAQEAGEVAENATEVVNLAPSAMLGVEGLENGTLNATAPIALNFTLDGSDPEGGNLSWVLDINGTAVANGSMLPAFHEHLFEAAGLYNVTFNVTDGDMSNSSMIQVVISIVEDAGPTMAEASDPGGDGAQFAEITKIEAVNDGTTLRVTMTLDEVWPSTQLLSAATYSINVNGNLYNSFVRYAIDNNPMTWDVSDGSYMPAGTSSWSGTQVVFNMPVSYLEGKAVFGPYEVHGTANYGALNNREVQDRVPDAGKLPPL